MSARFFRQRETFFDKKHNISIQGYSRTNGFAYFLY